MKLFVGNMVSLRCKMAVKSVLADFGLHGIHVELGEVDVVEDLTEQAQDELNTALSVLGFELLNDIKSILIEKVKSIVIESVHYSEASPPINFSDYLSEKVHHNYNYLSKIFSEVTGKPIQQYVIANKIERAKGMLTWDEFSIKEIAWKLHYSSEAHLCAQFKKTTGLTPSQFKHQENKRLIALEDL